ncbi:N5-glutamine methyltransferase family protein [Ornithinicoccus halotolerans]|uniref:N5-glutamine methyltransferase family protein n=1 Tax=Ornithinicoccus halotolerans TaxID=1748220 RepID=UPI001295DBCF|nr:class I SAM-dependent methyltransferase [Ornithinicoccus halotolerans]
MTGSALSALRADLARAPYTVEAVEELLGPVAAAALHREQPLPARRVLTGREEPAAVLVRCFVLGEAVPEQALVAALPSVPLPDLVGLGLVRAAAGEVRARVDLRPYGDEARTWWVVSDLSELALGGPLPTDHVLGIGGASTTLASWAPRPRVGRALDLGTGCGVQALHLSGHADHVVATDVSARALRTARLNAELNGLDWELRRGSLLEPVAGERFDLVVSNPPFVITPRVAGVPRYEYRDGGAAGDTVVADLVRGVGAHLAPGGLAQLLGNWEVPRDGDWREVVSGWLDGTGLDAWVVQREVQDPAGYAETWARDGGHRPGTPGFEELYEAWLADFEARGVAEVGFGIITLQRPATGRRPWRELAEVTGPVAAPVGPAVLRGVRARTLLAEADEDTLLDTAWRVAEDVTEERIGRPGAPDPAVIQARQGGGLGTTVQLDTVGAALLSVSDGEITPRQVLAGLAALQATGAEEGRAPALAALRTLVAEGMLLPP